MSLLFTLASVLTAALLFLVQPMVARMVLPAFGGSPQVWTTAMLFFQTALLAGYGYTHLTTTHLKRRTQPWFHLVVMILPLMLLPITLTIVPSGGGGVTPSIELLGALLIGVACPFVIIATSGPLVQRWFSWTDHPRAHDPYFLYAAGNVGSIGGLLAYPFLIEPYFDIEAQSRLWTVGYVLAMALLASCALIVHRRPARSAAVGSNLEKSESPLSWRRMAYWMLLAFVPSSLMLSVTAHLSTDVAAVPMLWVVPLATYLLTFAIAFSRVGSRVLQAATPMMPALVVVAVSIRSAYLGVWPTIAIQVMLVFLGGVVAHGKLSEDRPAPSQLTCFYLVVAVGGALGGLFNGLVAPLIFPTVFEYGVSAALALSLVIHWKEIVVGASRWAMPARFAVAVTLGMLPVALLLLSEFELLPAGSWLSGLTVLIVVIPLVTVLGRSGAVGAAVAAVALLPPMLQIARAEMVARTFFGVHRVIRSDATVQLVHGSTVHGAQDMSSTESRRRAISYYHSEEPLGDVFRTTADAKVVGVLGLGAGAIAAYGQPGQRFVFHEIDPMIVRIARERFTYLADTQADVEIVLGDGRLTLAGIDGRYKLLVVDAFTSDAIPVHLLTLEAVQIYLKVVEPTGIIAFNISNRYLDLGPVLRGIADELGIVVLERYGQGVAEGAVRSRWAVLARESETLHPLREDGWTELTMESQLWTDQHSSLWSLLRK